MGWFHGFRSPGWTCGNVRRWCCWSFRDSQRLFSALLVVLETEASRRRRVQLSAAAQGLEQRRTPPLDHVRAAERAIHQTGEEIAHAPTMSRYIRRRRGLMETMSRSLQP